MLWLFFLSLHLVALVIGQDIIHITLSQKEIIPDSLINIYLHYPQNTFLGTWKIRSSQLCNEDDLESETIIGDIQITLDHQPRKLVWHIPDNVITGQGNESVCIKVYHWDKKIATSEAYKVKTLPVKKAKNLKYVIFDVATFYSGLQNKLIEAESKEKKIGIVGAGLSGLFSGFLLDSVGFHNYEIIEASNRLGGRINTAYFGKPEEYRYQEMGAMRISFAYSNKNKTMPAKDHQNVFKLAEELNKRNNETYHIKFIEWIQHNENAFYYKNGIRLDDGLVPTIKQVNQNASLKLEYGEDGKEADGILAQYMTDEWIDKMANDMHSAYQEALDKGYDEWSEYAYARFHLGKSLNVSTLSSLEREDETLWDTMYLHFVMASAEWKTVDKGLSRISAAFAALLGHKVQFNIKVSKLIFTPDNDNNKNKIQVQWKSAPFDTTYHSKTYDRVIISAPFSVVRTWHLPKLSFTIKQAIQNLHYSQACKVALEFKTRFWEHGDRPIFGGCSTTDLTSGHICYPSYQLGGKGHGVMLGSYKAEDYAIRLASMPEQEHVALILDNVVELHGQQARDQFTGNYRRYCGILDQYSSGSWAEPYEGQHSLYNSAYFKIEQGLIFVGEHTDIKQAWLSAALDSALRGVVMILIEAGHVDDAKKLVQDWGASSWLKI
ncbi:flavin-containing amine oxidoreductase-domain containing protein [Chlamydoabsidia padenii]|nr:flavin-containing amine oxidoreductase-domain containing protein [Chlamydoabsidia padenii]